MLEAGSGASTLSLSAVPHHVASLKKWLLSQARPSSQQGRAEGAAGSRPLGAGAEKARGFSEVETGPKWTSQAAWQTPGMWGRAGAELARRGRQSATSLGWLSPGCLEGGQQGPRAWRGGRGPFWGSQQGAAAPLGVCRGTTGI